MVAGRLILEEIQKDPVIYRAHFKGDPCNSYLVVSMNESLAVDVRSPGMRDKLRILAAGLGAAPERMLYFDTGGNSADSMIAINDSPREQSAVGTKREEGIWRTLEIRNIDHMIMVKLISTFDRLILQFNAETGDLTLGRHNIDYG